MYCIVCGNQFINASVGIILASNYVNKYIINKNYVCITNHYRFIHWLEQSIKESMYENKCRYS